MFGHLAFAVLLAIITAGDAQNSTIYSSPVLGSKYDTNSFWSDADLVASGPITGVKFWEHNKRLSSIQVKYGSQWGSIHPPATGPATHTYEFDTARHETLNQVHVRAGWVIDGIQLITSLTTYGDDMSGRGGSLITVGDKNSRITYLSGHVRPQSSYDVVSGLTVYYVECGMDKFEDQHISYGTPLYNPDRLYTETECKNACRTNATCTGLDFNYDVPPYQNASCWLHGLDAGDMIPPDMNVTHFTDTCK